MNIIKIVIVGGGFAGLNLVKRLANDPRFEITLVDRNNYHYFTPLLYQVGMAFIELSNITHPFRRLLQHKKNVRFHLGCLTKVNPSENTIDTESNTLSYDYLVIALGTETNYFGMEHVKTNSWPLKTISDALNLRNKLLLNAEKAVKCQDEEEKKSLLTIVIAGGGPTGVEVAGMLAEMVQTVGPKDYPEVKRGTFKIYLVQGGPVLLNTMSKVAQDEALNVLTGLGVKILLNRRVKDYVNGYVHLDNGETIRSSALLWTSGVIGREVTGFPESSYGAGRRIFVDEYQRVTGTNNIFAIGDISLNKADPKFSNGHPQLAQVAIQQGKLLAENLKRICEKKEMERFVYKDKGSMAIISKYKAVADLPSMSIKGYFAWLVWLFIHLIPIAGFRNKLDLFFNWAYSFMTNDPTLRLIIRPEQQDLQREQDFVSTATNTDSRTTASQDTSRPLHENVKV